MSTKYNKGFENETEENGYRDEKKEVALPDGIPHTEKIKINDTEKLSFEDGKGSFENKTAPHTEIKIINEKEILSDDTRGGWGNKIEFILAVVGFAVGLGNVWRFPYLVQKHGGGAFLIPYMLCMFILAIPIFYMELALGQRFAKGPLHLWNKLCKPLAGIGLASITCSWLITIYYQMIVGWCFYYLFISFHKDIPYATCPCVGGPCNITNPIYVPECLKASPTSYYWYRLALNISDNIEDSGQFNWKLFLCLLLAWVIIYGIIWKGLAIMGKVVYFTTLFPYAVLLIFFIRAMMLDGSADGIKHMFYPQFDKLKSAETWLAAFSQVFFSLGLAQGSIVTLASYNGVHNNIRNDAFLISTINGGTSIFAGVTIFGILGYKAMKKFKACEAALAITAGLTNATCNKAQFLNEVAQGPGLTFIAFTEAMSTMKVPQFWSVLFFVMILSLGIGTNVGQFEPVRGTLVDLKILPFRNEILTLVTCVISFGVGIVFCQGSGEYWLQTFDTYCATFGLLTIALFEVIVVTYIYGIQNIKNDITFMLGKPPGRYWTICWRFTGPMLIMAVLIASVYELFVNGMKYTTYNSNMGNTVKMRYPTWALAICILLILSSIIFIPITALLVKMGLFHFSKNKEENRIENPMNAIVSDEKITNIEMVGN